MTSASLTNRIRQGVVEYGGQGVIEMATVQDICRSTDRSTRQVQIAALEAGIVPLRYVRNIGTIGLDGQRRLLQATAAIVGLGGLGGYVTEALARMGVGTLILIDGDSFEEHNFNRQILSSESRLGTRKTTAARDRIGEINSAVDVILHSTRLTEHNLPALVRGADVVVDGLDRLPTRIMLQQGAQRLGIPMVHGSIAGFMGQVLTIYPGDTGLVGLFGNTGEIPEQGIEARLGTPTATPMMVAAWEAQEAVKVLTGVGEPIRNKLLVIDMMTGTVDELRLA